jgi:hypothetical protein
VHVFVEPIEDVGNYCGASSPIGPCKATANLPDGVASAIVSGSPGKRRLTTKKLNIENSLSIFASLRRIIIGLHVASMLRGAADTDW